jgi:hypothetical protein
MTTQLTAQDKALIGTDFGEDIEKIAADRAAAITEAYNYGFLKVAADVAEAQDEEEKKEEKKEEKEEKEEKMDEESEKAAAELGAFIERGFFDGLRKLGSECHGDEFHYLTPYVMNKIAEGKTKAIMEAIRGAATKAKGLAGKGVEKTKEYHKSMKDEAVSGTKHLVEAIRGKTTENPVNRRALALLGAKELGKAGLRATPHAAVAGGGIYGISRAVGGEKE